MRRDRAAAEHATCQVLLLEDDLRIRDHLSAMVDAAPAYAVAVSVGSLAEAGQAEAAARTCAVHLVDLRLPDGSGTDWIRTAAAWPAPPRIGVISALGDERNVIAAIEAGAHGYLLKDLRSEELIPALDALRRGESPMTPAIARHLLKRFQPVRSTPPDPASAPVEPLSPRETEVLQLVAKGFSSAEIAELLGIAASTVLTHIKHIYAKLGVNSRSQAVFEAAQSGIISLGR